MRKSAERPRRYYFPDQLRSKLEQIPRHAATIVEAPSGFGKTTAVREYLKVNLPDGARELWYTCLGETSCQAWSYICELFLEVNTETAIRLKKVSMPTIDTLTYIMAIIRNVRCEAETYLVIDNFHLVCCDVPRELMRVFSMHGNPRLHIVFITQHLPIMPHITFYDADVLNIDSSVFFFDSKSIASLFRMEGIRLREDELERVSATTEGWIASIRLQIMNYHKDGSLDWAADIDRLVETAIWNGLCEEQRDFLLSMCVMDSFTMKRARIMMGGKGLPDSAAQLLKSNDFIRYYPDKREYAIHGILRDYLLNLFNYYRTDEFKSRILRLAGQAYAAESQYYTATKYFLWLGDFDAALSLPIDGEYLANQQEMQLMDYVETLVRECPEETLVKYPQKMLILAYSALFDRHVEIFNKLCRLIASVIESGRLALDSDEMRKLRGEYALLTSFTAYNDIRKMSAGRREALEIMGGPSDSIVKNMPWTFGGTSILNMFWREPGTLEETLRDMDECLPYYLRLTKGHGAGADSVLRAEALLMRGEDKAAEIHCHKALYEARNHEQICVCICAEQVLARIAILRADVEGYFRALANIWQFAKENSDPYVLRMVDLSTAVIGFSLGVADGYAKWLYKPESIRRTLCAPATPYAQILYCQYLLIEKRHGELYGISEALMSEARGMNYMLPQVYQRIFLALAMRADGNAAQAKACLKEALACAIPDGVYLPFAQQAAMEEFLNETQDALFRQFLAQRLPGATESEYSQAVLGAGLSGSFASLRALCRRQQKGVAAIKKALAHNLSPLTPREREIAQLARKRLSAKEIASKLFISETTVNSILKSVYSKLDIHSKAELNFKEF